MPPDLPSGHTNVWYYISPPIKKILYATLKDSDNYYHTDLYNPEDVARTQECVVILDVRLASAGDGHASHPIGR